MLPLRHPVGAGLDVWVRPDSLLVEQGCVSNSGSMALYRYFVEGTRLTLAASAHQQERAKPCLVECVL